jgi:hypothetical protein
MKIEPFTGFNILKPKLLNAPFTLDAENIAAGGFHRDVTMGIDKRLEGLQVRKFEC